MKQALASANSACTPTVSSSLPPSLLSEPLPTIRQAHMHGYMIGLYLSIRSLMTPTFGFEDGCQIWTWRATSTGYPSKYADKFKAVEINGAKFKGIIEQQIAMMTSWLVRSRATTTKKQSATPNFISNISSPTTRVSCFCQSSLRHICPRNNLTWLR